MAEEQKVTTDSSSHQNLQRKRWLISLFTIFLCAGLAYLIYWLLIAQYYQTTDDAYIAGNLVQVMPQVTGHVTGILADETSSVKKGQPLITLDKADADIALKNTEAKLGLTVRQVSELYQHVEQLKANVTVLQDTLQKTTEDYKRRQGLVINKTISAEDLSHAKIAADSSVASLALAKTQLASAIALIQNSDLYHHPQVQQAAANVRNAYLALQRTTIYAPETGTIAKRAVQVGQQVNPNTVLMIIVPLDQLWVNANFKESQLKNFHPEQPAELISDLYGRSVKFKGKVIGLSPGTGSVFDVLPPQNATGNWIKIVQRLPVRIRINSEELIKHPLQMGLSVTVTVDTHNRKGPLLTKVSPPKFVYQTENYGDQLKQADQLINQILQNNAKNISYSASS